MDIEMTQRVLLAHRQLQGRATDAAPRHGKDHIVWASLTDRVIGRQKRLIYMYRQT